MLINFFDTQKMKTVNRMEIIDGEKHIETAEPNLVDPMFTAQMQRIGFFK